MKSKVITWIVGGLFTLLVFFGGILSGLYLNFLSVGSTYTQEHIYNGRSMLWALKFFEEGESEKAKSLLRSEVSMKVLIVENIRSPTTSLRETELIESFYSEVIDYFELQGGFNETFKVIENDIWIDKPTPSMIILEEFKREHN